MRKNVKGRTTGKGQYWALPYVMARSDAFRSLSGPAVKVLIELHTRYNGANNGDLSLSYGEAHALFGFSKSTIKRAFDELQEKGFIVRTSEGRWYGRKAATWAATDKTVDTPKFDSATNDWKRWKAPPEKSNVGTPAERKVA